MSLRRLAPLGALVLAVSVPALAAPTATVFPADKARFLVGQRFDIRVEGKGTAPFSATLKVDGTTQPFTGATDPTTTDGITAAGSGGFNLRGFSFTAKGTHTIEATFTDSTGSVTVTRTLTAVDPTGAGTQFKNIIVFLGDGMGAAHRTAGRLVRYGATAGEPNGRLAMEFADPAKPGVSGMVSTHSLNSIITDSAPGMACYSTGQHANNNQEGVYPATVSTPASGTNAFAAPRVEYLAEYLHRTKGTWTGIVSTADLEDATPAANAVHTLNRGAGTGIVDQYFDEADVADAKTHGSGLKVLLGGGRRWFLPATDPASSRTAGTDYGALPADLVSAWKLPAAAAGAVDPNRDLLTEFKNAGFAYASDKAELDTAVANASTTKLLGLFGFGNMNVALDKIAKRRNVPVGVGGTGFVVDDYLAPNQPMLDEMTDAALKVLGKNPNGFYLMVEGAHIDKQSHLMDADRAVGEVLEFDRAIAVAKAYADAHPDTLIIVTADHECSGFAIVGGLVDPATNKTAGSLAALQALASDNAAPQLAPGSTPAQQTANAPKRQLAVGVYDAAGFTQYNVLADGYPEKTDIDGKLLFGFGANGDRYEGWLTKPKPVIDSLLPTSLKTTLAGAGYPDTVYNRPENALGFFIRGQVPGDQAVHTATDIPITAYGSGALGLTAAMQFNGFQQNTDVFFHLATAALGGLGSSTGTPDGGTGTPDAGTGGGGSNNNSKDSGCSATGTQPTLFAMIALVGLGLLARRRSAQQ